ncbi:spore maturation protein B [Acetivibrio straminisolvens JCM 21531]|uniref:Spore maturation protein B n=1 Tax=Acetivibrio straminisolvens JCM 21531 TaxID=1294263 RepID=W4VBB4_9FIRM|nr:spore maturation protein B [Acetivibrio straminisolvens JCM 21531]
MYFGAVGIKNIRHTLAAALIADFVGVIAAVWICTQVFGG